MNSSLAAYDLAGFNYEAIRPDDWMLALHQSQDAPNQPQNLGVRFRGVFTLPLCYNRPMPSSKAMTPPPVHNRPKQTYPCSCGADPGGDLQGNETASFREVSGLGGFGKYMDWCGKDMNY